MVTWYNDRAQASECADNRLAAAAFRFLLSVIGPARHGQYRYGTCTEPVRLA